jgi:Ca2+-binding RTX toxin-like protein
MNIYGTNGPDEIWAPEYESNRIEARPGNDFVVGGIIYDLVWLGDGDDEFVGELGPDPNYPVGDDKVYGGKGADYIQTKGGTDRVNGDDGNDVIGVDDGNDKVWGGAGNDLITGVADRDHPERWNYLYGGDGADDINAFDGSASVFGGAGPDCLYASRTMDLSGEGGRDELYLFGTGDGTNIRAFGGVEKDTFFVTVNQPDSYLDKIYIGDMAAGERLSLDWYLGGRQHTPAEVFDILDTNNDSKLTVRDRPTAFTDVIYEANGPGIALKFGEDLVTLHNVTVIQDWQFV